MERLTMKYRPVFIFKYFFPVLFFALIICIEGIGSSNIEYSLYNVVLIGLELYLSYFMFFLLTVEYEVSKNHLIVKKFLFWKKEYEIEDIEYIENENQNQSFSFAFINLDWIVLHFKNDKKLIIFSVKNIGDLILSIRNGST